MRILLVEDEPRLAAAVRKALQEEGHEVEWAARGDDALEYALQGGHEALVLDVMLPGRDGYTIARELRGRGSSVPILMLTARDSINDRVLGLDAGADDYLVKPFALSELLARVRALGRRATMASRGETELEAGDLRLDLLAREAIRGGKRIELTSREYALLELLMRHPGQVLTRSQLIDHVWSYDAEIESNVLETYIHYLRKKIDEGHDRKLIRTVRGTGYALRTS